MKKVLSIFVAILLLIGMASTAFADFEGYYDDNIAIEDFEETDEEVEGILGGTICVYEQKDTTGLSIYDEGAAYFTFNEYWTTNGSDSLLGYNKIVNDNGNHYLKVDYNAFFLLKLFSQGESYVDLTGITVDLKPTKVTGYTGICMRSRAYGCLDQHNPCEDGIKYPHEAGLGFTFDPNNKQVILIYVYTGSEVATSFPVDTGIDLTQDFHTYTIYDSYDGEFVFQFDHKTIATASVTKLVEDYNDKTCECTVKDADGNVKLSLSECLIDMAPTEVELSFCGEDMEVYVDNFGLFEADQVIEGTPAPETPAPETTAPEATEAPEVTTEAPTDAPSQAPTENPSSSSGCNSTIGCLPAAVLLIICGLALVFRKENS